MKKKSASNAGHATSTVTREAAGETTAVATSIPLAATAAPSPAATSTSTPTSSSGVTTQLQALEETCGYGDPLTDEARRTSEKLVQRVPDAIVARIIALAVRGGGTVAGIAFDPTAAKAALAEADEADAVATAAQMLGRRAQDRAIRLRAGVTSNASAIRTAMRGYAKTAQGASLQSENDEIRSLAKQDAAARKARRTRAENAANAATTPAKVEAETSSPAPTAAVPAPKAS